MPPSTENWKRFIKGHMYGFVSYYSPELHMQTNSICLVSFTVKRQTGLQSFDPEGIFIPSTSTQHQQITQ